MAAFGARHHDNALTSPAASAAAGQIGLLGGVGRQVSCATKLGLEGMVKGMAIECGPLGIRVNTLCPTFAHTPLIEETLTNPDRLAWIEEKVRLGRIGEVEDIMGAVLYLASDASARVTGSSLRMDRGWKAD
ncbi:MAG: SDR family NAD(P)-dependent oxidoreductase [Salipiger thiooxidans]|uniref:SDR family NAD(P)-dependent oxidoreductase n=1 Tax=Salipiger thiooxidans TaxID=282683 RepID=UPI00299E81FA|nr:SDR family oxidoreductase [Salipiger thiooxidans]